MLTALLRALHDPVILAGLTFSGMLFVVSAGFQLVEAIRAPRMRSARFMTEEEWHKSWAFRLGILTYFPIAIICGLVGGLAFGFAIGAGYHHGWAGGLLGGAIGFGLGFAVGVRPFFSLRSYGRAMAVLRRDVGLFFRLLADVIVFIPMALIFVLGIVWLIVLFLFVRPIIWIGAHTKSAPQQGSDFFGPLKEAISRQTWRTVRIEAANRERQRYEINLGISENKPDFGMRSASFVDETTLNLRQSALGFVVGAPMAYLGRLILDNKLPILNSAGAMAIALLLFGYITGSIFAFVTSATFGNNVWHMWTWYRPTVNGLILGLMSGLDFGPITHLTNPQAYVLELQVIPIVVNVILNLVLFRNRRVWDTTWAIALALLGVGLIVQQYLVW